MTDFIEIIKRVSSLAVFRNILNNKTVENFLRLLNNLSDNTFKQKDLISDYSEFVSELYKHTDSLTDYILKIVLED